MKMDTPLRTTARPFLEMPTCHVLPSHSTGVTQEYVVPWTNEWISWTLFEWTKRTWLCFDLKQLMRILWSPSSIRSNWSQYTKAYWCIECENCKKKVRYCSSCRGNLIPVELPTYVPASGTNDQSQYLQCLSTFFRLLFGTSRLSSRSPFEVLLSLWNSLSNQSRQCKNGSPSGQRTCLQSKWIV